MARLPSQLPFQENLKGKIAVKEALDGDLLLAFCGLNYREDTVLYVVNSPPSHLPRNLS